MFWSTGPDTREEKEEPIVVDAPPKVKRQALPRETYGGNYAPPSQMPPLTVLSVPRAIRAARGSTKPIRAHLSYYGKTTGSANTAFAFNFGIIPSYDSSWTAYQATFSEMKVLSAELHWLVNMVTVPTAFPAQSPNAACAYDPDFTGLTSPTGVNQLLEYDTFSLFNASSINAGAFSQSVQPQAATRTGLVVYRMRVPNTPAQSTTSTTLSTGLWRPTADSAAYSWGHVVGYVAQAGTSSVLQVEGFVRMEVEFRIRR